MTRDGLKIRSTAGLTSEDVRDLRIAPPDGDSGVCRRAMECRRLNTSSRQVFVSVEADEVRVKCVID